MNINAEITPEANDFLMSLLAKQEVPGMTVRVYMEKGGTQNAQTCLAFCPPGEESAKDVRKEFGDLILYFEAASVPYLQDMQIGLDEEDGLQTPTIKAPNSKKPAKPPKTFVLSEDCSALKVPSGESVTLTQGASVSITQALGGSYTVNYQGNLYRLSPEVTQKLGFQSDAIVFEPPEDGQISDQQCWDAMRLVYDPEIPVNVVGLGLIYKLDIDQDKHFVFVEMTLTSAGCGMGTIIAGDVKDKLLQVPNVKDGKVDVVFDPPWSYDNLEEEARLELGLI
ncbi:probable FeS assembly SUF system protein SufT [Marinobacter sp. LV10R510-11A]|uniref:iron-sulfur cluster assembly protein n=1 Tax=Marinobacter sp. LV10R510-11A TaxID=1415568 RepID=UPI000BB82056|nr:iron-sulfur cluster assembly protein [Marinobacter sp. LV10R510-11A]SOB75686.1 probable FeS assembly SUF system protein SufT [Marinobacter sp. LV10R510-11A]